MSRLQKAIDNALFTAQELTRQQKEEEDKRKADAAFIKRSEVLRNNYFKSVLEYLIKTGGLSSETVKTYLNNHQKSYGIDALVVEYVRITILLLTNETYGVESLLAKVGNGGLVYKGEQFKDVAELYKHFIDFFSGYEPLPSITWFTYLLTLTINDPTYLPAEVCTPQFKSFFVPKLIELVETENIGLQTPNLEELTADDAFKINNFIGHLW
jgi:hypothetical protein